MLKNKVAPPFREAEFDIIYGKGISKIGDLLDIAVKQNIVDKAGTWFSYGDERLGQGRENVRKYLEENSDLLKEIENKVRATLSMGDETKEKDQEKNEREYKKVSINV